ncbi:MAG: carboxypeptidase-like regulatory domain-containing protein [Thermoguttaceae bacterium]|nr:carboxypeptidase-like regulatory domain-containing protein [Thermoguttaceae bacterium]
MTHSRWWALTVLFFIMGCNDPYSMIQYEGLELAQVSGVITLDGQPLPMAQILFEDNDRTYSYGLTDADGRYTLQLNTVKQGVTPGRKTIRITTSRGGPEFTMLNESFQPSEEMVPVQYNVQSKESVEVLPNQPQVFDFDLKSDGQKVKSKNINEESPGE